MDVIGHNHIAANKPYIGLLPRIDNHRSAIGQCKNAFSILAANGEINNYWLIMAFNYWRVCQIFTTYFRLLTHLRVYPVSPKFGRRRSAALHWKQPRESCSSLEFILEQYASPARESFRTRVPNLRRLLFCPDSSPNGQLTNTSSLANISA